MKGGGVLAWLAIGGAAAFATAARADVLPPVAAEVVPFFSLRAGTSDRTAAEAWLGPPIRPCSADRCDYPAPPQADDLDHLGIEYDPEDQRVRRLDAWLKAPLQAAGLAGRFGATVLQRERRDGRREELFFPRLNGLILDHDRPDLVVAISYLAPRELADAFADQANRLVRDKQYAASGEPADNAVRVDPDYARGYLVQGMHYYYLKDYDEAVVRFTAAARAPYTARKRAHARVWLALVYWKQRDRPELAEEEFRQAFALAPGFATAYLEHGRFLKAREQFEPAIEAFTRASQLDAASVEARMELARLLFERKDWNRALPVLEKLVAWADAGRDDIHGALSRAGIYSCYGYTLAAIRGEPNPLGGDDGTGARIIAAYEKAIQLKPDTVWVHEQLGIEYERAGEQAKAEAAYRRALGLDPGHLGVNRRLADLLLELHRYDEARRQAEFVLKLKPDDAWQMMNVARAHARLGRRADTLAWLRRAGAAGYRAQDIGLSLEDGYFTDIVSDDELRRLLPGRPQGGKP